MGGRCHESPAIEQALAPLKKLAAEANEAYTFAFAEYEQQKIAAELKSGLAKKKAAELYKKNPDTDLLSVLAVDKVDAPTLKRYMTNDSTAEALGELLRQNPNGLLVYRDEIVSLIKGLDREDRAEGAVFI